MTSDLGSFNIGPKSLAPEIFLKIFLNLESHQTTIVRGVCKEFLEIIDNNKSLWRRLDWKQQEEESPVPALEMFDEKSGSTLKEVSIFQQKGETADCLLEVLDRSKNTLTDLSLKLYSYEGPFRLKLIQLASNAHPLNSLTIWRSDGDSLSPFPKIRLSRSCRQSGPDVQRSSNLQLLWRYGLVGDWDGKLDVSSLVSFADPVYQSPLQLCSIISNLSQTIVHLSISVNEHATTPSLSCPSLRVLEGGCGFGFPSWLDAPNLRIVIERDINPLSLQQLPISVEEIWLSSWYPSPAERCLEFLPQVCPKLKILKFGRHIFKANSESKEILKALRAREAKVQEGVKIEGINMVSLEKPIVPTDLFTSSQLDDLREAVGEVIEIKDYPDFIELEY